MLKSLYFFDFVDFLTGTSKPFLKDLSENSIENLSLDLLTFLRQPAQHNSTLNPSTVTYLKSSFL